MRQHSSTVGDNTIAAIALELLCVQAMPKLATTLHNLHLETLKNMGCRNIHADTHNPLPLSWRCCRTCHTPVLPFPNTFSAC